MADLTKYRELKLIVIEAVTPSPEFRGKGNQANFEISDYKGFDDIIKIDTYNSGMCVTIGKLKKEKQNG